MQSAKAFSPGNITCFFAIVENKNPLKKGSLGVSFAVNKGAIAEVKRGKKDEIVVNRVKKRFPTVETALRFLTKEPLKVKIKTQLPIGCGYGMSGACTLAAVYAANELFGLKKKSTTTIIKPAETAPAILINSLQNTQSRPPKRFDLEMSSQIQLLNS